MSFNSNNYYSYCTDKATVTTVIEERAAGFTRRLDYSSGTRLNNLSTSNTWIVKGLKNTCSATNTIVSPMFTHHGASKWSMVLTKNSDGLHLTFLLNSSKEMFLRAKLKANEILLNGQTREVFQNAWYFLKEGDQSETVLIRKTGEGEDEDKITLQCEIWTQCIKDELSVTDMAEPQVGLVKDLDEMLHKEVLTDFELHAGGAVLKAHRALLSVRSPYFAAMLKPNTKEAQDGFVQVSDVKPEVLKQVLLYMYTGVAPGLKLMPWDLLIAADKYHLLQLKRQCEAHIASCLSVDNAAETAAKASVYSCDLLWDEAVFFIKRNLSKVVCTPGWIEAAGTHPETVQRISELME